MSSFHAGDTAGLYVDGSSAVEGTCCEEVVEEAGGEVAGGGGLFDDFVPGLDGLLSEYNGGNVEKLDTRCDDDMTDNAGI
jgi:hypothetical protein